MPTSPIHRRLSRYLGSELAHGLLITLAAAAVPALLWFTTWSDLETDKHLWTIAGPSCPTTQRLPPALIDTKHPPKTFTYEGVQFTHLYAMAYCAQHATNSAWPSRTYITCQFNNPGAVAVTAGGRNTVFQIPTGRHAAITADGDHIGCVVGGWFSL